MTDWYARWTESRIGFHQSETNAVLQRHWSHVTAGHTGTVLVPLCGKSLDMLWLHQQGHQVLGIELVQSPCHAFFKEQNLPYEVVKRHSHQAFIGRGKAQGIVILQGDLFSMSAKSIGPVSAWYDRAAIVALPPRRRNEYAAHLASLLPGGAPGLMLTFDYPKNLRNEVPWPVGEADVAAAFGPHFDHEVLEVLDLSEANRWSLPWVHEPVLRLVRHAALRVEAATP